MNLKMDEYYRIIHFLKDATVDRLYPCEDYFYEADEEGKLHPITYTGDSFLFETNRQTFVGVDYVEVLLETSEPYSTKDVKFKISEYLNCYDPEMVLDADVEQTLEADTPTRVIFTLRKTLTMSEASRDLTAVRSVELVTPDNQATTIHEITFRCFNPKYTLEELDAFYENGKYYIASRLHMTEVPAELQDHVYTATAGYSWMSVWEFEARVMNDDQKNAMSYGKWLFATVDAAIEAYKVANGISDDDELFVMNEIVHSKPLRW
jgi:hypothetical protein